METVEGFAPDRPIRLDAPIPKNGGQQRRQPVGGRPAQRPDEQRPGGQRAPRKAGARGHGKPADRGAHAHAHTGKPGGRPSRGPRVEARA
jgi:ATP-dependent RNA helicase RhlE